MYDRKLVVGGGGAGPTYRGGEANIKISCQGRTARVMIRPACRAGGGMALKSVLMETNGSRVQAHQLAILLDLVSLVNNCSEPIQ